MTVSQQTRPVVPGNILAVTHGVWAAQTLRSSVELNIFAPLAQGPKRAEEVATSLGLNARGCEVLLDALAGLGLLNKQDDRYVLTPESEQYLVPDSPLYMGGYLQMGGKLMEAWKNLSEIIKTGQPMLEVNQDESASQFFPDLAAHIFPMSYAIACAVADALPADKLPAGARVLDLAAGSGVWSIPLVERNPGIQVDALDFPAVLDVTRRFAERHGVAGNYRYLSGNWREVDLEAGAYDVVLLGHILHSEGRELSERMLEKVFAALKPGGRVVIAEMVSNDDRTSPPLPPVVRH